MADSPHFLLFGKPWRPIYSFDVAMCEEASERHPLQNNHRGAVVSGFSLIGELLKPKSFAGLFGAAPSVSLATLALAVMKEGKAYASIEARSMLLGSIAFIIYAAVISRWMMHRGCKS